MVSFPGQGHINPLLRLANRLASRGLYVTFSAPNHVGRMIQKSTNNIPGKPITVGQDQLRFEFFSDGWGDDDPRRLDLNVYMHHLATVAREAFVELVNPFIPGIKGLCTIQAESGRPVSCIVHNPFIPWTSDVATDMGIPCAVLWVQSCAVYSAYCHYFHNLVPFPTEDHPQIPVTIPGLPTIEFDEVPSFLHPHNPHMFQCLKTAILGQFKNLEKSFCVLVDSFNELEQEAIQGMSTLSAIRPIGPLCKVSDGGQSDSVRADMWSAAEDCIEWLHTKPPRSVVHVSFGNIVLLRKAQMEEVAKGLLNCGLVDGGMMPDGFTEEAQAKGLVVQWCPQDHVLAHPSLACFVTHCGWNSSMEILCSEVPIVAAPQWGDRVTNAKFLADVYGIGVRLLRSEHDLGTLSRDQVEKCIVEVIWGPRAEEIKKNVLKWKKVADEALAEGGSSHKNLQAFLNNIRRLAPK